MSRNQYLLYPVLFILVIMMALAKPILLVVCIVFVFMLLFNKGSHQDEQPKPTFQQNLDNVKDMLSTLKYGEEIIIKEHKGWIEKGYFMEYDKGFVVLFDSDRFYKRELYYGRIESITKTGEFNDEFEQMFNKNTINIEVR